MNFNPMDMTDRAVLVTGASSGIGRGVSVLLSQLGARVILVGRNSERLEEAKSQLVGDDHMIAPFDVSDVDAIPKWMKSIAGEVGPLSGLVHSAGMHFTHPLRILKSERIDELMRVNFTAAVGLTKGLRQKGVRAESSSAVYVSSVMAIVGRQGVAAYAASKGALVALSKSLAMELASENIRVNCVAPGHVRTEMAEKAEDLLSAEQIAAIEDMHPLGLGEPVDVANSVAFLLADTSRWMTGQTLIIDGGYTIH
jgi:NAD(P)-dependent dehydrogenase (short-subunit alcohol dehydrogenase family)